MSNVDGPSIAGRTGYVPTNLEAAAARYVDHGWPRNDHRAAEVRPGSEQYAALVRRHIASLPDADDDSTYSVEVAR